MSGALRTHPVYRISPWRQYLAWLTFGPLIALMWGLALLPPTAGSGNDPRGVLVFFGVVFMIVALVLFKLARDTRMELSPEGVRIQGFGNVLETGWDNVIAVRLKPKGQEGLITARPMSGKGVERFADISGYTVNGVPVYDEEKRILLVEYRFIPIEAFTCHLKKGGHLRDDLVRFAPHLKGTLEGTETVDYWKVPAAREIQPKSEPAPLSSPVNRNSFRWPLIMSALPAFMFVGALILSVLQHYPHGQALSAVLLGIFALFSGYQTWEALRSKSWLMAGVLGVLTMFLALWAMGVWMKVGK